MTRLISCVLLLAVLVAPRSLIAQTPRTPQAEERVVSGTTEVIFDAVVRDKKGRPVKDLQSDDFQITEDGVLQEVKSFRLVTGGTPDSASKDSVDQAGSTASSPAVASQSQLTDLQVRNTALAEQLSQAESNAATNQSMGNIASLALDRALNDVSLRAAEGFERMEQTEKGQATKAQKVAAAESQTNPFRVGELMLFPNLGQTLHKAATKGLSMFVTIYPAKGATTSPKMSIELYLAGSPAGQLPIQLPASDQKGRIQYTATIPIDAFPPGEYELKATVTDGVTKAMRSERFTVQP